LERRIGEDRHNAKGYLQTVWLRVISGEEAKKNLPVPEIQAENQVVAKDLSNLGYGSVSSVPSNWRVVSDEIAYDTSTYWVIWVVLH